MSSLNWDQSRDREIPDQSRDQSRDREIPDQSRDQSRDREIPDQSRDQSRDREIPGSESGPGDPGLRDPGAAPALQPCPRSLPKAEPKVPTSLSCACPPPELGITGAAAWAGLIRVQLIRV
ncbi:hypothetical protein TURU_044596 [Turdus rufiventris]|nr:hypothetical protein TURU_044596 [Turdus rufiventris]